MDYYHIAILSLIQGLTEFIPVSSSAHLLILPHLTHWPDQGLSVDVALHAGSLAATGLYFWKSLFEMAKGVLWSLKQKCLSKEGRKALCLIFATMPALIGGYFIHKFFPHRPETLWNVGIASLIFAPLLWIVDRKASVSQSIQNLTYFQALCIGCAQVIALSIPGSSRLGCCLTFCRFMGLSRKESLEFSFLLSIPTVLGACFLMIHKEGGGDLLFSLGGAIGLTALIGLVTISAILKWIERHGFGIFCLYRLLVGISLILL